MSPGRLLRAGQVRGGARDGPGRPRGRLPAPLAAGDRRVRARRSPRHLRPERLRPLAGPGPEHADLRRGRGGARPRLRGRRGRAHGRRSCGRAPPGIFNVATGRAAPSRDVVKAIRRLVPYEVTVANAPRAGAITHRALRHRAARCGRAARLRLHALRRGAARHAGRLRSARACVTRGRSTCSTATRAPRRTSPRARPPCPGQREVAKRFGKEYFDGDRGQGYGGYRYDGRWVPIAERLRDLYGLRAGQRVLDVGLRQGLPAPRPPPGGARASGWPGSTSPTMRSCTPWTTCRPFLVRGHRRRACRFATRAFDLVISINTIHNLERARPASQAVREIERVSRRHRYVQVDSWLTEEQRREVRAVAAHRADLLGSRGLAAAVRGSGLHRRLLLDGDGVGRPERGRMP